MSHCLRVLPICAATWLAVRVTTKRGWPWLHSIAPWVPTSFSWTDVHAFQRAFWRILMSDAPDVPRMSSPEEAGTPIPSPIAAADDDLPPIESPNASDRQHRTAVYRTSATPAGASRASALPKASAAASYRAFAPSHPPPGIEPPSKFRRTAPPPLPPQSSETRDESGHLRSGSGSVDGKSRASLGERLADWRGPNSRAASPHDGQWRPGGDRHAPPLADAGAPPAPSGGGPPHVAAHPSVSLGNPALAALQAQGFQPPESAECYLGLDLEEQTKYFEILGREQELVRKLQEAKQELYGPPPPPPPPPPQAPLGEMPDPELDMSFCADFVQMLHGVHGSASKSTMDKFAGHCLKHRDKHREIVHCIEDQLKNCKERTLRLATWYIYDSILKKSYEHHHRALVRTAEENLASLVDSCMDWEDAQFSRKYDKVVEKWKKMIDPELFEELTVIKDHMKLV